MSKDMSVNSVGANTGSEKPQNSTPAKENKIGTIDLVKKALPPFSGVGLTVEQAKMQKEVVETAANYAKEHAEEVKDFSKNHPVLTCLVSPLAGLINLFK